MCSLSSEKGWLDRDKNLSHSANSSLFGTQGFSLSYPMVTSPPVSSANFALS